MTQSLQEKITQTSVFVFLNYLIIVFPPQPEHSNYRRARFSGTFSSKLSTAYCSIDLSLLLTDFLLSFSLSISVPSSVLFFWDTWSKELLGPNQTCQFLTCVNSVFQPSPIPWTKECPRQIESKWEGTDGMCRC